MTYRERRERRAERLRQWADKRQRDASAVFKRGEPYRHDIAFNTQPGHIPERARLIASEDRAHRSLEKAASMDRRADEIDRQAEHAIYTDDPDAPERLQERIAELLRRRERIKHINREIRRGPGWAERITPPLTDDERKDLENAARFNGCVGFPPYVLRNLAGNLTHQRQRLARLIGQEHAPLPRCRCCGERFTPSTSDATDHDAYCSAECERGALAEPLPSYAEAMQQPTEPSAGATMIEIAATLNQDPPPLADPPPFTLTPPAAGPDAHQPSFLTPPADSEPPCRR